MQVSGKILVLATFGIGVVMATGAWWYNYLQSYRAAEFWGRDAAGLIVGSDKLEFWELEDAPSTNPKAIRTVDLTAKPGLVHLRHALTYDSNFQWDAVQTDTIPGKRDWPFALRFFSGPDLQVVYFDRGFEMLAKLRRSQDISGDRYQIDVVPCPKLGPVIREYLGKVGVELK